MDSWTREFTSILQANPISVYLLKKYEDKVNIAISRIAPGIRWEPEFREVLRLVWMQEAENRDQ